MSKPFERVDVLLTVDGDSARLDAGTPSLGAGMYRIGETSVLVLNHLWSRTRIDLVAAARLPSLTGVAAMAAIPSNDRLARIIVDVIEPATMSSDTVALAAVCAAYDDALAPEALVECVIRLPHHDVQVRLAYDGARWTTAVTEPGGKERRVLDRCRFYRSIQAREGFGTWSPAGFRIEDDPRAADNAVWFTVYSTGGCEIAVITDRLAPMQLEEIAATPCPDSIDAVLAITHEPMSSTVSVSAIGSPTFDPFLTAAAAACAAASGGFGVATAEYQVELGDESVIDVAELRRGGQDLVRPRRGQGPSSRTRQRGRKRALRASLVPDARYFFFGVSSIGSTF